jgi:pilus assembly protein CpaF
MDMRDIFARTVGHYLTPIKPFLEDPAVTEVMINQPDDIYVERDGRVQRVEAAFADQEAYEAAVNNILQYTGKSLGQDAALMDSRLPDGSRVHVARPPCARMGMTVAIRKFNRANLDIDWLIELGTLTRQACDYLKLIVQTERNLLVVGGTSSGKTSLLNALSRFIPEGQRIVVIEDSAELQLQQEHVISLESRPPDRYGRGAVGIRELFRSSLRLRPDRIIIGEVRGGEALDMIQAMTSGHGGSMGTLHANSPADALNRLETLALMSKVELPLYALRAQIASAIDVIVQMSRQIGGRRLVTRISEIEPLSEDGQYRMRHIFDLKPVPGREADKLMQLAPTGRQSTQAGRLRPDQQALVTERIAAIFGPDPGDQP